MAARQWLSVLLAGLVLAGTAMPASATGRDDAAGAEKTRPGSNAHSARQPPDARAPKPASTPVPASPAPPTSSPDDAYADPSKALGATSPSCRYAVDAQARRSCRASGSVAQPHPLSAYGLDVRVGFSLTDPGKTFMGALQSMAAALWMALLYVVKGVLLMLEWAFSVDLTDAAMPEVRRTLARLHAQAFGNSWLLLGLSVAGLWGLWRGLVQRRTAETFTGLAATVGLMIAGLVLIAQPGETVGRAAQLSNDAGTAILAAATGARDDDPRAGLTNALRQVFGTTVRDPWCALQFGSVDFCDQRTGDPQRPTTAELWLSYPAQSWQRGRLHALMKPEDGGGLLAGAKDLLGLSDDRDLPDDIKKLVHEDKDRARMQDAGGTFPRLALLSIITIGLAGSLATYGWLGMRLLSAAGLSLVLLLVAPAMLIAPALGEGGRATFLAWAKRLLGAVVAKLVYAVFLAVALAASRAFASVGAGWFGTWLLQAAFAWGVFLKRQELVGFVSAGVRQSDGRGAGQALATGYHAWMLGRGLRQAAGAAAAPAATAASAIRTRRRDGAEARTAATSALAQEHLADRHRDVLVAEQEQARGVVAQRDELCHELRAVDRRLQGYDEAQAVARATGGKPRKASAEESKLLDRRERIRHALADPKASQAEQVVRHADRNVALTGEPVTGKDLDVFRARRVAELRTRAPGEHAEPSDLDLRIAGVEPKRYHAAEDDERDELRAHVARSVQAERDLAHAVGPDGTAPPHTELEAARRWLDPDQLRTRTADERARRRAERRQRRAQRGSYRVR
jgi:hypothetical protein